MITFVVVVIVVVFVVLLGWGFFTNWNPDAISGAAFTIGLILGVIVGLIVAGAVGYAMPTRQMIETYQLDPVYFSLESGDPIYLTAIQEDRVLKLLYQVDQEGVPREMTVRVDYNLITEIPYDAGESIPWVDHTWQEYEKWWYSAFGIGLDVEDKYIFHLHNEGETDIELSDLLK